MQAGSCPLGPRAAAAAWQPERCPPVAARDQQWCGTSARGCSRATGAHPRAVPGKAAAGHEPTGPGRAQSWQRIYQIQPAPAPLPICGAHAAPRAPSGKGAYRCRPPPETPSPAPTRQSSEHVSERARDQRAFPRKREVLSAVRTWGFSAVQSGKPNLYKMLGAGLLWGNQRGSTDAPETWLGVWLDAFLSVSCHRCLGLFWGLLMQKPKL